jgi:chromosome segregation ATPase
MLSRKSAKPAPPSEPIAPGLSAEASAAKTALDERNATIKRLEAALAVEKQNAAELREAADNLRFKSEILEKSYAKQLADARQKSAAAATTLADHHAKIAAFGADREDTIRLLQEARAELEAVKLDRDQLKRQLARGPGSLDRSPLTRPTADATATESTINQLMANADWTKEPKVRAAGGSNLDAKVGTAEATAPEIMLAPELVFTKKDKDE